MEKKELIRVAMRGIRPMMERTISSGNAVDIARMVKVEKDNIISCCKGGYHGYSFWCQRHRLKVVVRIGASTILIPILYSRINNLLEHIIPSLKEAEKMCSVFGKDFRIG